MKKNFKYESFKLNFKNKTVLVTGASKGIGFEISKSFLKCGANLLICSSNKRNIFSSYKKLKKIKKSSQKLFYLKADVSNVKDVKKFINFAIKKFKKIDILINNAGVYGPIGDIEKINWNAWIKEISINLFGSVLLCKEIMPYLKKKNSGKIIQLSGGGAASPAPRISAYSVSKAAIVRFVENLVAEVKNYKIYINAVAPGAINTGMLDTVLKAGPKKLGTYYFKKAQKQKKLGGSSIKDACDLILFLASKYSDGINGKLISALWDDWKNFPKYKKILKKSDIYNLRRISSFDRGYTWGQATKKSIYDISLSSFKKNKKI